MGQILDQIKQLEQSFKEMDPLEDQTIVIDYEEELLRGFGTLTVLIEREVVIDFDFEKRPNRKPRESVNWKKEGF